MRTPYLISTICATAQLAAAWGDVGHRTVGYLASKYFTQEAKDLTAALLANDKGWDISDAATWADVTKHYHPYSSAWHYIDAEDEPPKSCHLEYKHDCSETRGCVVSAIVNQTSLLLNASSSRNTQKEALMYVLHFIGDLHQPLHTEGLARGGNDIKVCFDHRCGRENLHSIWDTDIVHKINGLHHSEKYNREREAASKWADELFNSTDVRVQDQCADIEAAEKCSLGWSVETNKLVCSYVLAPGVDWLKTNDLGAEYYLGAAPIVTAQVTLGGIRAAAWINSIAKLRAERNISVPDEEVLENVEL